MAPDLGTDEQTMAWIMDTYSMNVGYACPEIVTGKPVELGGCVGRREATGRGVVYCIMQAHAGTEAEAGGIDGRRAGLRQRRLGRLPGAGDARRQDLAVGDRYGAIRNPRGIDIAALHRARGCRASCSAISPRPRRLTPSDAADHCPAPSWCRPPWSGSSPGANAGKLRCRILAEGANGPTTPEADTILASSDIFIIPDVLCNAGGVTVSYFEWVQDIQQFLWSEEQVNQKLEELMLRSFQPGAQACQGAKTADAHGGPEPGRAKGGQGKGAAGALSVT